MFSELENYLNDNLCISDRENEQNTMIILTHVYNALSILTYKDVSLVFGPIWR